MEFWNKALETIGPGELETHTVTQLKVTVERALRAPFYQRLLKGSEEGGEGGQWPKR